MMEKYDAFISYRHLPNDKAVATRLQSLLENSGLCKRKEPLRIFRDQSELQSSNDLGREIKDALLQSRYLIVVCSELTKYSKWCMEEIRLFKEAHHGSTQNILTLLISGESGAVLPEELLFEELSVQESEEGETVQKVKVGPLSADVRADSLKKSLKKLKVEFLRIAAPILGCGFDDLYQRRQRRRRRNATIAAGGAIAVLTIVLAVVSVAAYRTWISENRYKGILADSYVREAGQYAGSGKMQEALLYYTQALTLKTEQSSAAIGAALLLQEYAWPILEEEASGRILGQTFLPVTYAYAGDMEKGSYLCGGIDGYRIINGDEEVFESLPQSYKHFLTDFSGWWVFCDEQDIYFYHPESKREYTIPIPQESSDIYEESNLLYSELLPAASVLNGERAVVVYKGIVHLYSINERDGMKEIEQADLSVAYPDKVEQQIISSLHEIYPSQDGSLALISSDSLTAFYDMETLSLKAGVQRYIDDTTGMDISSDNEYFALAYGTQFQGGLANPGGYFEVYSTEGEMLFTSEHYSKEALLGIAFHPDQSEYLIVWSASNVHVWNWKEGREIAAPVREENICAAFITKDGRLSVDNRDGKVSLYVLQKSLAEKEITVDLHEQEREKKFVTYYPLLEEFEEVGKLDCGNEEILRVCFGDAWIAVELQSRDILLFRDTGQRMARITPQHNGNVVALFTDPEMQYIVLVLEETIAQADSFHFSTNSIVEIWDVSSLLMLFSLNWENRKIESACITGEGIFCWSIRGVEDSLCLTVPYPDEEALRFLCNLSCLSLDEKQDIICKKSSHSDFQMGNWGTFISDWKTEDMLPENKKEDTQSVHYVLQEMVSELDEAKDYAQEEWFQRCDELWQSLREEEIPYRLIDLDVFYSHYFQAAASRALPEKMAPGLEAYLELQLKAGAEDNKTDDIADSYTMFDALLSETLTYTQIYDEQIIRFLKKVCFLIEEDEESIPDDVDDLTRLEMEIEIMADELQLATFRSWIGMLEGDKQAALLEISDVYRDEPIAKYVYEESFILERLMEEEVQKACEITNQWILQMLQLDDDGSTMQESLKLHLEWADILTMRGMIKEVILEEYLRSIDQVVFGLKVMEVSPSVQEAGMLLDDIIISINGRRIADLYQCFRIRQDEGMKTVEVLRNEDVNVITLPDLPGIGGKMIYDRK